MVENGRGKPWRALPTCGNQRYFTAIIRNLSNPITAAWSRIAEPRALPERGAPVSFAPRGRALRRTHRERRAGPVRHRTAASAARGCRVRARTDAVRSRHRPVRRGRRFCAAALTLLAVGCASGPAARPAQEALGPAPADAQLVVTVRQPLLDDLFAHFDVNALLPPGLETDVATLSAATQRMVLSLRPQERGATLALVPAGRYPAQLMGWQLHLSDLAFQTVDDSGVRHYWSNPVTGFGILVFPNLIFMFWLDPAIVDVSDATAPEVREMIRIALQGSPVAVHPAAISSRRRAPVRLPDRHRRAGRAVRSLVRPGRCARTDAGGLGLRPDGWTTAPASRWRWWEGSPWRPRTRNHSWPSPGCCW